MVMATDANIPTIVTIFEIPWNFTTIPINAHNITNVYAAFFFVSANIANTVAITIMMADHTSGDIPNPFQFAVYRAPAIFAIDATDIQPRYMLNGIFFADDTSGLLSFSAITIKLANMISMNITER